MSVSKEDIFEAADQIHAAGGKPTYESIREMVGGSYTTIGKALKEWQGQSRKPAKQPAPEPITAKLAEVASDIWVLAMAQAHESLAKERAEMKETLAAAQAERDELAGIADRLQAELDTERANTAELRKAWESERQALVAARDAVADAAKTGARAASKKSS